MKRAAHCTALLASLALLGVAQARGEQRTAIFSLEAPPAVAERMERELAPALRDRRIDVLGRSELRAAVARASGVRAHLEQAGALIAEAERLGILMKREQAIETATKAIVLLDSLAARWHAGQLLARAQMARGLALLLRPADEPGALVAFAAAVAADPTFTPDPDRTASLVARLFTHVREQRRPPPAPTAPELATLAALVGVPRLLGVEVLPKGSTLEAQVLFFEQASKRTWRSKRVEVRPETASRRLAALVEMSLAPQPRPQPQPAPPATLSARRTEAAPTRASASRAVPWYRRWWVITLAGVVVAGSAAAIAVVATREREPSYRFDFRF